MIAINNEEISEPIPQYISENDAYFLLFKCPPECRNREILPTFPFFETSQNKEGEIIVPISQNIDEMDVDDLEDAMDEDGDVEMTESRPSENPMDTYDVCALKKWVASKPPITSMPDIFANFLKTQVSIAAWRGENKSVSEIMGEFIGGDQLTLFSNEFRDIMENILKENLPKTLSVAELSGDGWKRSIRFAFQKIDDGFFPSNPGISRKKRVYKPFHKKMVNRFETFKKKQNIISDERISEINRLIISNKTSPANKQRINNLTENLIKDGYKTPFGNIIFRRAEDDRLRVEVSLHFSYTKSQNLNSMDHGTVSYLSAAQNALQNISTYSMIPSDLFEDGAVGINLKSFQLIIDLLILNKNQSAIQLAKNCGLNSDMHVIRRVQRPGHRSGEDESDSDSVELVNEVPVASTVLNNSNNGGGAGGGLEGRSGEGNSGGVSDNNPRNSRRRPNNSHAELFPV